MPQLSIVFQIIGGRRSTQFSETLAACQALNCVEKIPPNWLRTMTDLSNIKALTWDVGGTVFDWRGTIQDEVRRRAEEQGADVNVKQFATDWRVWSFDMLGRVNRGELPWTNLDYIHRQVLDDVLEKTRP